MALQQLYVNPAIAGNSGTGTIGDPYGDLEYCLAQATHDATDGDQINIKAGTPEVLAAPLNPAAHFGVAGVGNPTILRGYTAVANDGGMAEIDCGGHGSVLADALNYYLLADLEIHSPGDDEVWNTSAAECAAYCCIFHKGASTPTGNKYLVNAPSASLIGCKIHTSPRHGVYAANLIGCYVDAISNLAALFSRADGCIFRFGETWSYVQTTGHMGYVKNSIFYSTVAATRGLAIAARGYEVLNNIFCGISGAGGEGVDLGADPYMIGYNAFYNNTATYTWGTYLPFIDLTANDVTLAADPFTDAANGDFSLTAAAKTALRGVGWPAAYLGAHASTDGHITIGAIQYGEAESSGGGGGPVIGSRIIRGLGAV